MQRIGRVGNFDVPGPYRRGKPPLRNRWRLIDRGLAETESVLELGTLTYWIEQVLAAAALAMSGCWVFGPGLKANKGESARTSIRVRTRRETPFRDRTR